MLRRLFVCDSVTRFDPEARGAVGIVASHGGVIAAHIALASGVVGLLLNDAGLGLDSAGIAGLPYCDSHGVPCAALDHRTARIGDGSDNASRGIVSHANAAARHLGVHPGQRARDAAELLRRFEGVPVDPGPIPEEARQVLALPGCLRPIVLVDSASMTRAEDVGAIVLTGSHGGLLGGRPETAIKVEVFAAVYNDAGIGIDEAGVSRLPALDDRGIAAATVAAASARIGQARSTYETGVLSRVNRVAAMAGACPGMPAKAFASLVARLASPLAD